MRPEKGFFVLKVAWRWSGGENKLDKLIYI